MDGKDLPFQAIYKGKTKQSLPKVNFPSGFSLSANMKHHSNTLEVLKHLREIVIPYVEAERKKIGNPDQFATFCLAREFDLILSLGVTTPLLTLVMGIS